MTDPNDHAFAAPFSDDGSHGSNGLTKREYYAVKFAAAMVGNLEVSRFICETDPRYKKQPDGLYNFSQVVSINAVEFSDALIAELNQPPKT